MNEMSDKESIQTLRRLIEKGVLSKKEEAAVRSAIGILSWTSLAESRIAAMRSRQEKKMNEKS